MSLKSIIDGAKKILIIGHINPDGDCLGAGLALRCACINAGKTVDFVCDSVIGAQYHFLPDAGEVNKTHENIEYDTIFALDCADAQRMGKYLEVFKAAKNSINIDHHVSNTNFGKVNFVEKNASSTCAILGKLLTDVSMMDKQAAEYVFVGLSTDTGHFMHSNTTAATFSMAAQLCEYGIDNYGVAQKLYRSLTVKKTKLMALAIESMRFFQDETVAIITITAADLESCGCVLTDTENLIDLAVNIGSVVACACVTEHSKNSFKVSFRSKGVSILEAAASFGGGGHKHAAGCIVFGKLEDAVDKIKKAIMDGL